MKIDTMDSAASMADAASAAAATHFLHEMRLDRPRRPGGSTMGRLMQRSRTRTAGIRFEWVLRSIGPVLRVVATWTDQHSQPHHTSFSVQCNGLEGALDRAIAARISCGAPLPNRADLLQRLQKEFATAPNVAAQLADNPVSIGSTLGLPPARTPLQSGQVIQGSFANIEASVASSQANG